MRPDVAQRTKVSFWHSGSVQRRNAGGLTSVMVTRCL
jgi:hypothetical protein